MRRITFCLLIALLFMFSCAQAAESRTFFAMDTMMTLQAPDADDALLDQCEDRIYQLEEKISVTNAESQIARLNAGEAVAIDDEVRSLLAFAFDMSDETGGALDITLYPIVRAWGFTTGEYRVPADEEIVALLAYVGDRSISVSSDTLQLPDGVMIDLGSVAKGYASDVLAGLLRENGVDRALVDLGGNIYCIGSKAEASPRRIGLQSPTGDSYIAALSVSDCAIVTSGVYERYFEADGVRYGHIFDPSTGRPVNGDLLSVTVVGKSGARCDALSTALFVMGSEKAGAWLRAHDDVEALLLSEDALLITDGLRGIVKISDDYASLPVQWIER